MSDVPPPPPGRRLRARDALVTIGVVTLLLVVLQGDAARNWGEQMDPGIGRDVVLAFGKPAGWVADRLPFADAADDATSWIASEDDLGDAGGFDAPTETTAAEEGGIPPVSPESFDPLALGEEAPKLELDKLLVTGDSLAIFWLGFPVTFFLTLISSTLLFILVEKRFSLSPAKEKETRSEAPRPSQESVVPCPLMDESGTT